jgi:hypothetical protein
VSRIEKQEPVRVEVPVLIGKDERGSTFAVANDRSGDYILAYRRAGSSSGRHYHTGKCPRKDPEILYLLSGEALLRYRGMGETEILETRVTAPARVEIDILTWHELIAVTVVSFWELNSLEDVKADSVRVEPGDGKG